METCGQGLPIFPRPTKNKGAVIGGPRPKIGRGKYNYREFGIKDSDYKVKSRMKRNGKTVRGNLNKLLPLVKRVVAQEYVNQYGGELKKYMRHDLEHIHGKDGMRGGLPATISPINLQLLDRKTHDLKTDGLKISKSFDGRDKEIQRRLIDLGNRILKRAGIHPNWRDFRAAFELEVYE